MAGRERIAIPEIAHTVPVWAVEETCRKCREQATHKVEESSGPLTFHPLTAYLCCTCFQEIVGYDCAAYPYDADDQLGGWRTTL